MAAIVAGCRGAASQYPIESIELCGAGCIDGSHPNDKPADLPSKFCGDVGTREDGKIIFFQRFNLDIDTLSSSGCAPCGN